MKFSEDDIVELLTSHGIVQRSEEQEEDVEAQEAHPDHEDL